MLLSSGMGQPLIKGMLGVGATHCVPPHKSVAWACFMLGERVDTGRDTPVHAGNRGAVA
jgi:hypothetical protein